MGSFSKMIQARVADIQNANATQNADITQENQSDEPFNNLDFATQAMKAAQVDDLLNPKKAGSKAKNIDYGQDAGSDKSTNTSVKHSQQEITDYIVQLGNIFAGARKGNGDFDKNLVNQQLDEMPAGQYSKVQHMADVVYTQTKVAITDSKRLNSTEDNGTYKSNNNFAGWATDTFMTGNAWQGLGSQKGLFNLLQFILQHSKKGKKTPYNRLLEKIQTTKKNLASLGDSSPINTAYDFSETGGEVLDEIDEFLASIQDKTNNMEIKSNLLTDRTQIESLIDKHEARWVDALVAYANNGIITDGLDYVLDRLGKDYGLSSNAKYQQLKLKLDSESKQKIGQDYESAMINMGMDYMKTTANQINSLRTKINNGTATNEEVEQYKQLASIAQEG